MFRIELWPTTDPFAFHITRPTNRNPFNEQEKKKKSEQKREKTSNDVPNYPQLSIHQFGFDGSSIINKENAIHHNKTTLII